MWSRFLQFNFLEHFIIECPTEVEAFVDREQEICIPETLSVFVGTWNVNGGKNMYNVAFRHEQQSMDAWLFPQEICMIFVCNNFEKTF